MNNVYIVFAGENCGPKDLVSVHHCEAAARAGAESYIHKDTILTGYAYKPEVAGRAWTSKGSHRYVAIETHAVI